MKYISSLRGSLLIQILVTALVIGGCAPYYSGNYQGTVTLSGFDGDIQFFNVHQDNFGFLSGNLDMNWHGWNCDGSLIASWAFMGVGNINTNLQCNSLLSRFYCNPISGTDDDGDNIVDSFYSFQCILDISGGLSFWGNFFAEN